MELEKLNEGDLFTLYENAILYKILSFEMDGVRCIMLGFPDKLIYFSYLTVINPVLTIHQKINYRSYLQPEHIRNYSVYHFRTDEHPLIVEPEMCESPFNINKGKQKYTQLQRYLFTV